jgi:hypothetical protein
MFACGYTRGWIGFSEDDAGAGAPSRRRSTARGRAVSIANALRSRRGDRSTYRCARITRFAIQTITRIATTHGARNAIATPIMSTLHMIAPALCARVRRSVASGRLRSRFRARNFRRFKAGSASPKTMADHSRKAQISGRQTAAFANALRTTRST